MHFSSFQLLLTSALPLTSSSFSLQIQPLCETALQVAFQVIAEPRILLVEVLPLTAWQPFKSCFFESQLPVDSLAYSDGEFPAVEVLPLPLSNLAHRFRDALDDCC